jgi:hypothetical protein
MSAINPNNINGNYPVAGQDNDSQGFRDNFTNIRNNLSLTKTELEDLQNKVILKTALSGTTLSNDMSGSQLVSPQLRGWTQAQVDQGTVGGSVTLDFTFGNFQKITPSSPVTLTFENWPALVGSGAIGYGNMRIWFDIQDTDYTVTLPSDVSIAVDDIAGYDPDTRTIEFDSAGNYVFDISSADGGDTYMIFDVTRNRATFRDPSFYFNDTQNPTLQVGHNIYTYSPTVEGLYGDTLAVYGSSDSYAPYSRHLNRISDANSPIQSGGWSVSSSRANVDAQNTPNPIFSGDFIGYFSGFALTANAATYSDESYFETAGIKMFATGSNVSVGGNLAVFTKADGGQTVQAIGVEHNQSVKFFANVITSNVYVPSSATSGGSAGQISYDSDYVYVCLGNGNWKRANLAAW